MATKMSTVMHILGDPQPAKTEENVTAVCAAVQKDCQITMCELSEDTNISYCSVHSILTEDLGMILMSAQSVPKLLSINQKENHIPAAQDLLDCVEEEKKNF